MPQRLQELDFAHSRDREAIALSLHADLLEGNHNSSAGVPSLPHLSEGTFADLIEAVIHAISYGRRGSCDTTGGHRFVIALGRCRIHSIVSSVRRSAR